LLDIDDPDTWLPVVNLGRSTRFMIDIPKLQKGGVDLQVFAAYTSGYALAGGGQDFARANSRLLSILNGLKWTLARNTGTLYPVISLRSIGEPDPSGRIGALSSIEGAYSLNGETGIELLRQYFDLGVRMLAPTWNYSNALGEGVSEKYRDGSPSAGGLTALGRSVIAEMNRLGIAVDVSHLSEATFWDLAAVTKAPIIASHSCCWALNPNVRNLKDAQIQAIAESGGVVQVCFHRPFLAADPTKATIATLVDHIDHVVGLAGIDHVGLGSDFDGGQMPANLTDASLLPNITRELVKRGYTESEIRKILGENTARALRAVWEFAAPLPDGAVPQIDGMAAMGTLLDTSTPTFTARIRAADGHALDPANLRVIIDGVEHTPAYDPASQTASFAVSEPLNPQFHVVTFVAAHTGGGTARKAIVVCLQP
jgi:membrane dipeptidase